MINISVIIPVYNTEIYLRECLDSVIAQTLYNIEIICINDGSMDNSLKILKEYQEKDKRIKIINQENMGLSEARNAGLKVATGEYVHFLDSDDLYLDNNCLNKMYSLARINSVDILFFNIVNFYEFNHDEQYPIQAYRLDSKKIYTGLEILKEFLLDETVASSCCYKMFKRNIFSKLGFKRDIYFEDGELLLRLLPMVARIMYDKGYYMKIRERKSSITTSFKIAYLKSLEEIFKTVDQINDSFITKNNKIYYKLGLLCYVLKLYVKSGLCDNIIERKFDILKQSCERNIYLYILFKRTDFIKKIERFILECSTYLYIKILRYYFKEKRK